MLEMRYMIIQNSHLHIQNQSESYNPYKSVKHASIFWWFLLFLGPFRGFLRLPAVSGCRLEVVLALWLSGLVGQHM